MNPRSSHGSSPARRRRPALAADAGRAPVATTPHLVRSARVGIAILTAALVACGGSAARPRAPPRTPTPLPWTGAPAVVTFAPAPTIAPKPDGVRACTSSELRVVEGRAQGATGWWVRPLIVGTEAGDRCVLEGPLAARFVGADGATVAQARLSSPAPGAPGWAALAARSAPTVSPIETEEGQAMITLSSYGDCAGLRYASIVLRFASAEVATRGPEERVGGRCDAPGQQLGASASPLWTVPPAPAVAPRPPRLEARLEAPASARPGETLRYAVRLTNVSDAPYALSDCPWYLEWVGGRELEPDAHAAAAKKPDERKYAGGANERYELNCAVPEIGPHETIAFSIELRVPADALGPDTLRWELAGTGATASSPITFSSR